MVLQVLLPLRVYLHAGNPSWHECSHSFSWRMMLRHKDIGFKLDIDAETQAIIEKHGLLLAPRQQAAMAKTPHMLHRYAQAVGEAVRAEGKVPQVRATALVSLNGREYRHLVHPATNLADVENPLFGVPDWVLPLDPDMEIGNYPKTPAEKNAMFERALKRYANSVAQR